MAYKRLVGVLPVKDGHLVKSYGCAQWRPAGDLCSALRNLDRWGADEILVLDISRSGRLDDRVLGHIAEARVSTPLAYGGGVRSTEDLRRLMDLGCDRFLVESLWLEQPEAVGRLADLAGRQALIASVPLERSGGILQVWRPNGRPVPWDQARERLLALPVSEYCLIAREQEGKEGRFPDWMSEAGTSFGASTVLWFGGIGQSQAKHLLGMPQTAALLLGNMNTEREQALLLFRASLLRCAKVPYLRTVSPQ